MEFLFKLGIVEIDFSSVISFFAGLFIGALLVCLLYAIFVVASLGSKNFLVHTEDDSLTTTEVKEMIINAQKNYQDKALRGDVSKLNHCKNICKDLVYGIATRFYPKSKYPLLEMTVDETLMLVEYIKKRVDKILDRRGLRLIKKLNVAHLLVLSDKTNQVVDSKFYQVGKEINNTVDVIKKVVNVVNPVWWFKKSVGSIALSMSLNKLCTVVIAIVGEETYKIYSKKIINKDVEIESNVDDILNELDKEIKNIKEDDLIVNEPVSINESRAKYKCRVYTQENNSLDYNAIFDENMNYKAVKKSCEKGTKNEKKG